MQILKTQLHQEHEARIKLENYSRRSNLKFFGIQEKPNKRDTNCEELIREVVQEKLGLDPDFTVERCHRFGPRLAANHQNQDNFPARPIIVKFSFFKDRQQVWNAKKSLCGSQIFIKEDFPPEVESRVKKTTTHIPRSKKR